MHLALLLALLTGCGSAPPRDGIPPDVMNRLREAAARHHAGLPPGPVPPARPRPTAPEESRWWTVLGWGAAAWATWLALLLTAGLALSRHTLRVLARGDSPRSRALRTVYAAVLRLASASFYVLVGLLLLMALGTIAAVFYVHAKANVPWALLVAVPVVGVAAAIAIVRSVFAKVGDPFGIEIGEELGPKLHALVRDVGAHVGADPIERVLLRPDDLIAVTFQRPRTLYLGLGALEGMTQAHLRAILAHEYGHLTADDPVRGDHCLRVRAGLLQLETSLEASHMDVWYNPGWWLVTGFHRLYLLISQGASRLQELLADSAAAAAYGGPACAEALRQSVRRGVELHRLLEEELATARRLRVLMRNVYAMRASEDAALLAAAAEALSRSSRWDSHPPAALRIARLERLPTAPPPADGARAAWDLFEEPLELQLLMARLVGDFSPAPADDEPELSPGAM